MAADATPAVANRGALAGPRLYVGERPAEYELFHAAAGQVAVATVADAGKQRPNEDSAVVIPLADGRLVIAVADGVGGQSSARAASNATVRQLRKALQKNGSPLSLRSDILDGIEAANRAVLDLGNGAATTLALAEIGPGYVRSYHVGDSVVLLCGQRGLVKLQTIPHSPVGFAIEAGILDATAALHHESLNVISNVIGMGSMRIEISSRIPLSRRDTLLVGSDGLFDNLLPAEIIEIIRKGPLANAAAGLARLARERMQLRQPGLPSKPDDFSAILYRADRPADRRTDSPAA